MKLRKLVTSVGLVLLGGCSFQASCGSGKTLNMKNAEALVKKAMVSATGIEPTVDCPDKVKIEKGGRFDCEIAVGDVKGVVTIEQTDDQTNVEVKSVTGLMISAKLEGIITERLQGQTGTKVTVDCGPRVRAAIPGDSFRCRATDDAGTSGEFEVKVKDVTGNVDFRLVEEPAPPPAEAPAVAEPPAPPAD